VISDREAPTEYDVTEPCGWEGERQHDPRDLSTVGPHGQPRSLTIEPCPDCGGSVELIQESEAEPIGGRQGGTSGSSASAHHAGAATPEHGHAGRGDALLAPSSDRVPAVPALQSTAAASAPPAAVVGDFQTQGRGGEGDVTAHGSGSVWATGVEGSRSPTTDPSGEPTVLKWLRTCLRTFGLTPDVPTDTLLARQLSILLDRCLILRPWSCPGCGFTFDAIHTNDTPEGGYSCPACAEELLRAEVKDLERRLAASDGMARAAADKAEQARQDRARAEGERDRIQESAATVRGVLLDLVTAAERVGQELPTHDDPVARHALGELAEKALEAGGVAEDELAGEELWGQIVQARRGRDEARLEAKRLQDVLAREARAAR
jgi:hypothetical protein